MATRIPITFRTREELEAELGPPDQFILTERNLSLLTEWAMRTGLTPVQVHGLSRVALANLYQTQRKSIDIEHWLAEAIRRTAEAVNKPIDKETLRPLVEALLLELAPRRLEIITPTTQVMLSDIIHYATPTIIKILAIGQPVMMVGPAGCGKTTIAEHASKALQLPLYITSTVTDTHEIMGFIDGYGKYHATPFRIAFEYGGIWVADEIDAWEAAPLLSANSALANGFATFPDATEKILRHANFRMVATANTYGNGADRMYVGRNTLDAATLDRFATVNVDYDLTLERIFANGADEWLDYIWTVRQKVTDRKIRHVVSSRAIIMGAAGLAAGLTWDECLEFYLFKGMSPRDRDMIDV